MKKLLLLLIYNLLAFMQLKAQELFVFTEPASNMAKGSIGLRCNNYFIKAEKTNTYSYQLIPEIMLGISKKVMIHADVFLSNRNGNGLQTEGGSIYAKYRFYSKDDIHSHCRMAAYGRYSFNNSRIQQQDIETYGQNSGYEIGLIVTKLIHKLAISASASFEKVWNNSTYSLPYPNSTSAINYTLSFGKLLLPKTYTDYHQPNLNVMVEFLGQTINNGRSYLAIAPSIQLIINSQTRIDIGYRHQLYNSIAFSSPSSFILRLEHNFFSFL